MRKYSVLILACLISLSSFSQKINGNLKFNQGQTFDITLGLNSKVSQEAMGQAIDFTMNGSIDHNYQVTNSTVDNTTLKHNSKRIQFTIEGMGQQQSFDSDKEEDKNGPLGKPITDKLAQTYSMVIDNKGKVLAVQPDTLPEMEVSEQLAFITNMLSEMLVVIDPPSKGSNSLFAILPGDEFEKGQSWADSTSDSQGRSVTNYTLSEITDSTLVVNINGSGNATTKNEPMAGLEIISTMTTKSSGKIILDKSTGIIRQKTLNIESHGTVEGMGIKTPMTSTSNIVINVIPKE